MKNDVIVEKSKTFAIDIVNMYKFLTNEKNEYILSKQILRSGTSIGANVAEAKRGQSKADFVSKMSIALKEASETAYWLELLYSTEYLSEAMFKNLYYKCDELIRILVSITKNAAV